MERELGPDCRRVGGLDRPRVWMVRPPSTPSGVEEPAARRDAEPGTGPRSPLAPIAPLVWGLTSEQRVERALRGVAPVGHEDELLVADDVVLDEKLVTALALRPGTVLLDDQGVAAAACVAPGRRDEVAPWLFEARGPTTRDDLEWRRPAELVDLYDPLLRKATPPVATRVTPDNAAEIEGRLFRASYKGVTDFVTKWVWPRPARAVTRALAAWGVTPNAVTALSWLLVIAATWLFWRGHFGWGLAAAWAMTFLDTVDGKLARVTLQSSRVGHVLDHGLDIVHPPFWYAAWALAVVPTPPWWELAIAVVVGGYVVGRLLEGLFMLLFGIETHSWRPVDSWFRTITARRNPNLVLLSGGFWILGDPALAFGAVALWTAASILFHSVRLVQAAAWRLRGGVVEAWYLASRGALVVAMCLALGGAVPAGASGLSQPSATAAAAEVGEPLSRVPSRPPPADPPPPRSGPPPGIGAQPLRSGSASQSWDFAIVFESGHQLFVRFLVSNVGMGDNNAAAVWHLITPAGSAYHFKNGRQESGWSLEDRGLTLRVGSSLLQLGGPTPGLEIQKKKVRIALRFTLPGQMLHSIAADGQRIDVVSLKLPVEGSIWFRAGAMAEPVETRGLASFTRVEVERGNRALRRSELLSLDPARRGYVTEVLAASGARRTWALWLDGDQARVAESVAFCADSDGEYPIPRRALAQAGPEQVQVAVETPFLRYDPLQSLPSVLRLVFPSRPMRLWSRARWVGRDRDGDFDVSGISRVSFGDPVSKAVLRNAAPSGAKCELDSAS